MSFTTNLQWCVQPDFQCSLVVCNSNPLTPPNHQLNPKCIEMNVFVSHCHRSRKKSEQFNDGGRTGASIVQFTVIDSF